MTVVTIKNNSQFYSTGDEWMEHFFRIYIFENVYHKM